ncbi:MAG: hypothetical protein ABSB67_17235 [Bryobacteraceae bacterium]
MTTKALLRRLIVTTSVPPFASLYRWIYQAFIQIAVRRLRRFPGLRAIYLRRGLAAGDGVPGVSDIDLAVVGDWDAAWQSRVADSYAWLAHRFPVFDPTLGVYTPESLARLFDIDPFLRHRFAEGRRHWKLLLGEDCLSRLRSLDENQAAVGYEMELRVWWRYFAYISFSGRADLSDRIFVNSLCYKVVAESIRMERGLRGLPVPETREEGIAEALSDGRGDAAEFLDRLEQSARQRHLRYRGEILEDTGSFLVPFIEGCYADLASRLVWQGVARQISQAGWSGRVWPGLRFVSIHPSLSNCTRGKEYSIACAMSPVRNGPESQWLAAPSSAWTKWSFSLSKHPAKFRRPTISDF